MGSIVWIKRYTGPFYVALDNICTIGSMVSAFGHTRECENHCAKLRTDARKRAGLKVCFAGFEDDVASIRMFYSMSNHMIHQESAQELSNHHIMYLWYHSYPHTVPLRCTYDPHTMGPFRRRSGPISAVDSALDGGCWMDDCCHHQYIQQPQQMHGISL